MIFRYRIFENFFDMASGLLCAQIIDHLNLTVTTFQFLQTSCKVQMCIFNLKHYRAIKSHLRTTFGLMLRMP